MISLFDQDHYEVLETRRDSTLEQIERSYRLAMSTYADDSLAGYSVFSDGDSSVIRERIEEAYRVLGDQESRSAYDAALDGSDNLFGTTLAGNQRPAAPLLSIEEPPRELASIAEFEELDDGAGDFDGARLRRYRLRCGMELEEIAEVTKIHNGYLLAIEEERFGDLPSKVYIRGFVTAFASMLGLDANTVANSYMKLYDEGQESHRKPRFF